MDCGLWIMDYFYLFIFILTTETWAYFFFFFCIATYYLFLLSACMYLLNILGFPDYIAKKQLRDVTRHQQEMGTLQSRSLTTSQTQPISSDHGRNGE